jgi:hypothetical protein
MSFLLDNKKIELNNMDNNNSITCNIEEMDLTKLTKIELLEKCEELGIKKCKSKNKSKLIELINNSKSQDIKKTPKIEFIEDYTKEDGKELLNNEIINSDTLDTSVDNQINSNTLIDNQIINSDALIDNHEVDEIIINNNVSYYNFKSNS